MNFRHSLLIAVIIVVLGMAGCGSSSQELPPHVVADNSSLAPKNGRRIQLDSINADLTREQCIMLIDGYRKKAGPEGQVGVHKPSKLLEGTMVPWCVENFDGRGVFFNDHMF